MEKPGVRVSFDCIFEASSGYVAGAELSIVKDVAGFATSMTSSKSMDINVFHKKLVHPSVEITSKTANSLGIKC